MILFEGRPVEIGYEADLRDMAGNEAHAATYIPARRIVLDTTLRGKAAERDRVLVHELFHFVWVRLGNPRRRGWEELLRRELAERARGEAGWSAEWRKRELAAGDAGARTRRWREYCCESFCDTGAWVFRHTGGKKNPRECTLGKGRLEARSMVPQGTGGGALSDIGMVRSPNERRSMTGKQSGLPVNPAIFEGAGLQPFLKVGHPMAERSVPRMNTKNKQEQKNQSQRPLQGIGPKKQSQKSGVYHEQERAETRLTR